MSERRPFTAMDPVQPTLWQRIFRRRPKENAFIEIHNLLAGADSVLDVNAAAVEEVCRRYRMDLAGPLAGRLERLYRDYLTFCLEDRQLSDTELACLSHLQTLLRVDNETAQSIHDYVARYVYSCSVSEVLEDGVIDADERAFLQQLQHDLAVPARAAARIEKWKLERRRA
jgi:hypothetical protein